MLLFFDESEVSVVCVGEAVLLLDVDDAVFDELALEGASEGAPESAGGCDSAYAFAVVVLKLSVVVTSKNAQAGIDVPPGIGFGNLHNHI